MQYMSFIVLMIQGHDMIAWFRYVYVVTFTVVNSWLDLWLTTISENITGNNSNWELNPALLI